MAAMRSGYADVSAAIRKSWRWSIFALVKSNPVAACDQQQQQSDKSATALGMRGKATLSTKAPAATAHGTHGLKPPFVTTEIAAKNADGTKRSATFITEIPKQKVAFIPLKMPSSCA